MQNLINVDQNVFYWLNSLAGRSPIFDFIIKVIAVYTVYIIPVIMLYLWFAHSDKIKILLLNLCFNIIIIWQVIAHFLGKALNRPRPFESTGVKEVMFHRPDYSFPSDHALFFAIITAFLYVNGYKKLGNIFLIITILVSVFRVIAGFHWPFDVIAGWAMGFIFVYLFHFLKNPIEKYFSKPILWLAKKIKLA